MSRLCVVDECAGPLLARGLCARHYGNPAIRLAHPLPTRQQRFWSKVEQTPTCWLWTGSTTGKPDMYGVVEWDGRRYRAHRLAYEFANGPIPAGMQIDHMCHVRLCVNPSHLQAVTTQLNTENRRGPDRGSASGIRGVYPTGKRWYAAATHNGVSHYGGTYGTKEEAAAAAIELRNKLHTNNLRDRDAS